MQSVIGGIHTPCIWGAKVVKYLLFSPWFRAVKATGKACWDHTAYIPWHCKHVLYNHKLVVCHKVVSIVKLL